MLFNSLDFALFLIIVFSLYWLLSKKSLQLQNLLILVASYVFYAWWDWRFLGLIAFSSLADFVIANLLKEEQQNFKRKILLSISIILNLGLLGFFKYYNFFADSWITAWDSLGISMQASSVNIILPVGISFYTFQTLSYTIDIYSKKLEPTSSLIQFMAYVSFFPQLVAGPIERASNLLPQFQKARVFNTDFAMSGIYLIIWGLFKKVVVADNCAFFVNQIFDSSTSYSSMELLTGAILFGFQIYGDFSGYSDIAIGVARLFGFSLMTNFLFPYFSRDISEFWRRWHISLSTWFRDYLYIPLGGSRGKKYQKIRNVILVFLVSGFWHGANWTFIVWGFIHGLLFMPLLLAKKNRTHVSSTQVNFWHVPNMILTFLLVTFAWIFFRADSVAIAYHYILDIIGFSSWSLELFHKSSKMILFSTIILLSLIVMLVFEYITLQKNRKEVRLNHFSALFIALLIVFMGVFKNPSNFIYFQF